MSRKYIRVNDNTKIQLHIYVLGYYPQGESILIIVWDNAEERVLQSTIIDFYSDEDGNKIIPILDKYHISTTKLDFIIWTHPDKDHSVGLKEIIKNYSSYKTVYLIPDGFTKYYRKFFNHSVFKSWIALMANQWRRRSANIERVNASKRRLFPEIYGASAYEDGFHDRIEIDIEILTPNAGLVVNQMEANKTHKGNYLSISLLIRFGGQSFYFGGDAENPSIRTIDEDRLNNIVFIKIPHHASKTSTELPKTLNRVKSNGFMANAVSVSTSFAVGNISLPDTNVLELYKPFSSEILLTENDDHKRMFGIWNCNYNIRPYRILSIDSEGDASCWYVMKNKQISI